MISHKHKCIFIHIPKCAGTTVKYLLFPNEQISWKDANYNKLHGWCPKRKFFMQHATAKQLLETDLVTEEIWNSYYKFTFIRNPWDRAVSDYFWLMNDQKIKDSFENYLLKKGDFEKVLTHENELYYRGDHAKPQTDFFDFQGSLKMDYIGRFENFDSDIQNICTELNVRYETSLHVNKSKKKKRHYSDYYDSHLIKIFNEIYHKDIELLEYSFQKAPTNRFSFKKYFGLE